VGVNLSAVKALTNHLDVLWVSSVRMIIATCIILCICVRNKSLFFKWKFNEWKLIFVAGFLMVYAQQIAFAGGLSKTSATNAALVMTLGPALSLILERITFGRAISLKQISGMILSLIGVVAVVLHRPNAEITATAIGDFWILCSVGTFAVGGLCVQKLTQKSSPLPVSLIVHVIGSFLLILHFEAMSGSSVDAMSSMSGFDWGLVLFSAVFATGIGALVWSRGIATIGVGRTASYIAWVPIFGVSFAALFFSEPISIWHFIGVLGVIAGTLLVVKR
jgi:drug/metabolite transporter (DMT)-like permease